VTDSAYEKEPVATAPLGSDPEAIDEGGLGTRVRSGLRWSLLNSAALRVLSVLVGLVIARLVTPGEFGTYAAGLLVLTALLSFNEAGVSVAVIRWQGRVEKAAATAVTCSLASTFVLFIVAFAGAPAIGSLLNAPDAAPVIRILSFGLLLDGLASIPNALLGRAFQQRRRAIADVVGFVVGSLTSIGLASAGWGAQGLACGLLVTSAVAALGVISLAPARPLPRWDPSDARELLRTGLPAAGTSLLLLAILNVDYVVVSSQLGVHALGLYVLAFNVSSWISTLLSLAIRQVSLPAFSRLANDRKALEEAFSRSLTLVAGVSVLGGVLLAGLADPIISLLYGERWLAAIGVLPLLAVLGAIRVILDLCYDLLIATGRAGSLLKVQIAWLALLVIALPVGASLNGIVGVAAAHAIVAGAVILPLHAALLAGAGLRLRTILRALTPVLAAGAVAGATAVVGLQIDASPLPTILAVAPVVTAAYVATFALARGGRAAVAWASTKPAEEGPAVA
jgi:PST family polysaccharide transporter